MPVSYTHLDVYKRQIKRLDSFQYRLYAEKKRAILLIFQGLDAAGKDGTIRHVMAGVDPQGCAVRSFKVPTPEEAAHDFLWRVHKAVPERGEIGIFNRSHYELSLIHISGTSMVRKSSHFASVVIMMAAIPMTSARSSRTRKTRIRRGTSSAIIRQVWSFSSRTFIDGMRSIMGPGAIRTRASAFPPQATEIDLVSLGGDGIALRRIASTW